LGRFNDLTGQRFGRLTVIKRAEDHIMPSGEKRSRWFCECDCGNEITIIGKSLIKKNGTKSCGCFAKENMSKVKKKYNTYDLSGEYGIGYTLKDEEFWFDLEDYNLIKDCCWRKNKKGYIVSTDCKTRKIIFLHRIVTNCPDDLVTDHIHGKETRYDNRKSNLRIVTKQQNGMNSSLSKNNTSGVTGVVWNKRENAWQAAIRVYYKKIHLGYFTKFDDAVKARKEAEEKYFGEYSYDNSQSYNK
jgi:hypothetical protein